MGLQDFREEQVENLGLKGETHFSKAFEGNTSKCSLGGWKALNYLFFDQKLSSVIRI